VVSLGLPELTQYADLFVKNNITGKRLFMLTGDDLLQIGILSVGHRRELLDEIGKLKKENYRLLNFPPLVTTPTKSIPHVASLPSMNVNKYQQEILTILIGCIKRDESSTTIKKWKMIIDRDGSPAAQNSIKEVTFIYSRTVPPDKETIKQPPFVSTYWRKKAINDVIECVISYKDGSVSSPKETMHSYMLCETNSLEELSVTLDIRQQQRDKSTSNDNTISVSSSCSNLKGLINHCPLSNLYMKHL
jgi:hypothetical protein